MFSVRILCPEQMGHGRDIDNRLRADPDNYTLPTHHLMLESNSEFLDVVNCSSNTNSFGISLGGAAYYYLQHHRPDIIKRTVLVSPAILCCVVQSIKRYRCSWISLMPYQYPNGALTRSFESIFSGKPIQWKKREQIIHEVRLSASAGLPGDYDDVGTNRGGFCFASLSMPTISMHTS